MAAARAAEVMGGAGAPAAAASSPAASRTGVAAYYASKLDALQLALSEKAANLRRLEAQVRRGSGRAAGVAACLPARARRARPRPFPRHALRRPPPARRRLAPSRSARC